MIRKSVFTIVTIVGASSSKNNIDHNNVAKKLTDDNGLNVVVNSQLGVLKKSR